MFSNTLVFYLNGTRVEIVNPPPQQTLLQYVRSIGLTGTKLGCAEGGCGACTVLVSTYAHKIIHRSVHACLTPICSLDGKHVITIEAIGPLEFKGGASQCGFCTPGIVMSLYALLRNNPKPTEAEVEEAFDGNLCRCTGYRPILDAARRYCVPSACGRDDCCKKGGNDPVAVTAAKPAFVEFKEDQELIFPPALINELKRGIHPKLFEYEGVQWIRPTSLHQLIELKHEHPQARLVNGNTEVGIETKFKNMKYPVLISPVEIADLKKLEIHQNGVTVGACVTLTELQTFLRDIQAEEHKLYGVKALLENLRWFAGRQIRNVATIAGNIVTASPISDLNPVLMAIGAELKVKNVNGERVLKMEDFFLGYRKTQLAADEVVVSVHIPFTRKNEFVFAFKQAKRRDDDIAIVTSGMHVYFENGLVKECKLAFGGMGAYTLLAKKAGHYCIGKKWDRDLLGKVSELLVKDDLPLDYGAPGAMVEYRRSLAVSFFFKFLIRVMKLVGAEIDISELSLLDEKHRPVSKSSQIYVSNPDKSKAVGNDLEHQSAFKQATGQARYTADMPLMRGELFGAVVLSTRAHAKIKSIDSSEAIAHYGVKAFISHKDVHGSNTIGPVFKDEELFAKDIVYFHGQMIGLIVADTQEHAQQAAKLVKIEYEELPVIVTIEQAIEKQSFFELTKCMQRGDIEKGLAESDHVLSGEVRIGGQNHFYLETQCSVAIPKNEDGEIEIIASTQNPTETQHLVALVLGIPSNKVICRVKRMGGGFGGKETRSVPLSCALAVAASKLKVPVRCMLDRDEDMILTGQRHPFLGKYKVGFSKEGLIKALQVDLFSNAGYSADLSIAVMERAVSHSDNVYYVPNVKVFGRVCRTNLHSNTAFRGFGGPQGMLVTETWMRHISDYLQIPVQILQELNMYKEGQLTHFNQPLENFYVPKMYQDLLHSAEIAKRQAEIDEFNKRNKYVKRGLAIVPTKFGIAFTARFLNQAGALVHVYSDGSVLLTHAGTEMGQGLHTKMIQVCADTLGIPVSTVHVSETATDKVPNTPPTAASAGADLNGMAVKNACEQIKKRLMPYYEKNPGATFSEVARLAFFDRVNLSANGFYKTPDLAYDWTTNSGRLFNYFTFGVCASEVEVDVLTGDFQIVRSDILMDLGKSLNPSIDVGQIEGAFVQGAGWCTIEETLHFPNGQLFTRGPGNYKIPGFTDIPIDFRVRLIDYSDNTRAVYSSKAVGEPPLFLGSSVFFGIKEAIKAYRSDNGLTGHFRFDSPATPERIRMACEDKFTQVAKDLPRNGNEWLVRA